MIQTHMVRVAPSPTPYSYHMSALAQLSLSTFALSITTLSIATLSITVLSAIALSTRT